MVTILGFSIAAIPAALTFDRLTNGLTRPFFGWVSTGSWIPVFSLIIGMDILTGLLALLVLKPMRRVYLAR